MNETPRVGSMGGGGRGEDGCGGSREARWQVVSGQRSAMGFCRGFRGVTLSSPLDQRKPLRGGR